MTDSEELRIGTEEAIEDAVRKINELDNSSIHHSIFFGHQRFALEDDILQALQKVLTTKDFSWKCVEFSFSYLIETDKHERRYQRESQTFRSKVKDLARRVQLALNLDENQIAVDGSFKRVDRPTATEVTGSAKILFKVQ